MNIAGRFKERPELLEQFQEDGLEIVTADDALVLYDDGSVLHRPFEPTYISEDAGVELMAYVEAAAKLLAGRIDPEEENVIGIIMSEALQIWENDLCHRFDEWQRPEIDVKINSKYDKAIQYARMNKNMPLFQVAELQRVGYYRLVEQLRCRYGVL